ncbi:hypothetical protein [Streptomyces sp. NPDC057694]
MTLVELAAATARLGDGHLTMSVAKLKRAARCEVVRRKDAMRTFACV